MTITIVEVLIQTDLDGNDIGRHADIIISDDVTHYTLGVGGLPLKGDLHVVLDAREAELWTAAQEKNNLLTTEEVRLKLFNSSLAGGWTNDEFQEAVLEN